MHRVLIVDNHPPLLRSLEAALRHRGLQVVTADSVGDARLKLLSATFDAVLSDYDLGTGTGLEVLREAMAWQPTARRGLMSGALPPDLAAYTVSGIVQQAFAKPFLLGDVARWIRTGRL